MELMKSELAFPDGFLFGASSSAIQFEGALQEDGRGRSVIDDYQFSEGITDYAQGSDHYHRWKEDIALAHEAGLKSYRFSISWTRILPQGRGKVNQA